MPPYTNTNIPLPLSPAELSYLHTSLSQTPAIRPDGRAPTQFRPLVAETDILPSTNGSARICFADGTEAIVGVKAEVEKSRSRGGITTTSICTGGGGDVEMDDGDDGQEEKGGDRGRGEENWVEISIEIPGMRDDDALPIFLGQMLTEALLADGGMVRDRLWINEKFHWRLYIDILLLSQPLSYPLPLLSLTTHLALLSTRTPALISQGDEDPFFDDDWEASIYLFPRSTSDDRQATATKPPVTLLVMTVGDNILFDPSKEELAVADSVVAISVAAATATQRQNGEDGAPRNLRLVALRTIDPPSRLTAAGVPNLLNNTTGSGISAAETLVQREKDLERKVWQPPRGGISRGLMSRMIKAVVETGGVGEEVMEGLMGVDI